MASRRWRRGDGVKELACFVSSGASAGLGLGNERTEYLPFLIREVGGVWSSGRHNAAAPSRYGSHILRALTPSQTPSKNAVWAKFAEKAFPEGGCLRAR